MALKQTYGPYMQYCEKMMVGLATFRSEKSYSCRRSGSMLVGCPPRNSVLGSLTMRSLLNHSKSRYGSHHTRNCRLWKFSICGPLVPPSTPCYLRTCSGIDSRLRGGQSHDPVAGYSSIGVHATRNFVPLQSKQRGVC